jgi:hypothetical protein
VRRGTGCLDHGDQVLDLAYDRAFGLIDSAADAADEEVR